ncbi:right-handed parallel beta-helix repeat-containing protein [Candidatus Binatia bacterium]|nr:right-handed parallel beta-helix repeat-containing protein [Candidatus Binatia bacterium]
MRPNVPAKLPSRSLRPLAIASLAVCAALACGSSAHAQSIGCGSVVGPNQTVVLDADLACTRGTGGITVIGPATLDLGGHLIGCAAEADRAIGVTLVGKRAQLKNGSVLACKVGVEMADDGRHRVEQVVATANVEAAFRLDSDASTLRGSTGGGTTSGIDFVVRGDRNLLEGNTTLVAGLQPAPIGFRVLGNANRLRGNTAGNHTLLGFSVDFPFERNVLQGNTATGNGSAGIAIDTPRTSVTGNVVTANGREGIFVTASSSRITRNDVRDNGTTGIRILGGVGGNVISRNTALNNDRRGVGAFDLQDSTPECGTNRWSANLFATAGQPCIE